MKMAKKVYVYTKNSCVQCKFVKKFLESANIEFSEINIDNNPADMEFVKGQGFAMAPVVFYGEVDKNGGLLLETATKFAGNNQTELKKLKEFFI
jgi:glutaredoxin-like protein NrdH